MPCSVSCNVLNHCSVRVARASNGNCRRDIGPEVLGKTFSVGGILFEYLPLLPGLYLAVRPVVDVVLAGRERMLREMAAKALLFRICSKTKPRRDVAGRGFCCWRGFYC